MTDQEFLDGIRNGDYRQWDADWLNLELYCLERIDSVRRLVSPSDYPMIAGLYASDSADDVFLGHSIGRRWVRDHFHDCGPLLEARLGYWRTRGDVRLQLNLLHDLMEDESALLRFRDEFVRVVKEHPDAVRQHVLSYMKTEAGVIEAMQHRLGDVFSGGERTLNAPGKAFIYVLYLGVMQIPASKKAATRVLTAFSTGGDEFFRSLVANVLLTLADQ